MCFSFRERLLLLIQTCRVPNLHAGGYLELFQNLGASIRAGSELAVKWEEAVAVLEIIELAIESSKVKATMRLPDVGL